MQAVDASNSYFLTNSEDVCLGNVPFVGIGGTVPNGSDSIKLLSP